MHQGVTGTFHPFVAHTGFYTAWIKPKLAHTGGFEHIKQFGGFCRVH
jgi:hypothetical protein